MESATNENGRRRPTAVLGIIGDEILCGRTRDINGHYMARRLDQVGVEVEYAAVLPDRVDAVSEFVIYWSARCDYVFTSGGIGPTHDDITREAVAVATGRPLTMHPEAEAILREFFADRLTAARLEMARFPKGASLIYNPVSTIPGCRVDNVYVFPGIPEMLEPMFEEVVKGIDAVPDFKAEIATALYEGDFAPRLIEMCHGFPEVKIGSYPRLGDPDVRTVLALRCPDEERLECLRALLVEELGRIEAQTARRAGS